MSCVLLSPTQCHNSVWRLHQCVAHPIVSTLVPQERDWDTVTHPRRFFFLIYKYLFPPFFINFSTSEKLGGISGQRWTPSCLTSWAARSCSRRRRRRWKWAAEIIWRSSTGSIRTSSPAARPSETTRPSGTGGAGTSSFLLLSFNCTCWLVLKCGWNGAWGFLFSDEVCGGFVIRASAAVSPSSSKLWQGFFGQIAKK